MDELLIGVFAGAAVSVVAASLGAVTRYLRPLVDSRKQVSSARTSTETTASREDGTVAIRVTDYANGVEHTFQGSRVSSSGFELEPGERVVIEITDKRSIDKT